MSLELCRRADLTRDRIEKLENALADFYRNPPASYYAIADESSQNYRPGEHPFHLDLVSRVVPGASVLELGCGSAHFCRYVEERGGTYTGVDYSSALIEDNRRRFPRARFFPMEQTPVETFDLVASLYTIEHVVDPPAYLERMWGHCHPGGRLAIICPEFVESPGLAPSVFYGRTPRSLRLKLRAWNVADVAGHLLDVKVNGPLWKKRAREAPPGAFWINLRPRVLHGADYVIDSDAVHMTRLKDLVWFLEQKGAAILQTSAMMPHVPLDILRFNCYVVAQKPLAPGRAAARPEVRP